MVYLKVTLLTDVITDVPLETVKNEPAFLPRLDFPAHLHQVAFAHLLCEDDEGAGVDAVATRLHVRSQVELLLAVRQITCHWTSLWWGKKNSKSCVEKTFL